MNTISIAITGFVALIHVYIMWLEMFGWTTRAKKVFKKVPDTLFEKTKPMAANQGLYNGFLAAGLVWAILINNGIWSINVAVFFLSCVAIAGIYGAATVQKTIFYVQSVPAIFALICIYLNI